MGAGYQSAPNTSHRFIAEQNRNRNRTEKKNPEAGFRGLCSGSEKGQGSVFDDITVGVLKDNDKLLDWFHSKATCGKRPVVQDSEHDKLNVFAAAQRALECGDDPIKLFVHIVGKGDWGKISNKQETQAQTRLRELGRETSRFGSTEQIDPNTQLPAAKNTSQQSASAERLSSISHAEIREVLEWGIESKLLTSRRTLDQFDEDAQHFLKQEAQQTLVAKLLSARDVATTKRAPTAQSPSDSPAPIYDRTPHGKEASALPAQSL